MRCLNQRPWVARVSAAKNMSASIKITTVQNSGKMSEFLAPFDVPSKLTDEAYHVRFSHVWNGIATRHSDTIDTKFFVEGRGVIVGLAHTGFAKFQELRGRNLTDREASFIAAEYLRERLEQEDERPLYDVSEEDVLRLADLAGIC
jgi:hypothetical protein